jgi:HD-GYP domain-containing protein (c-di-GMP phosphodiesterase class II)
MAAQIALSHHEWFDGNGYPRGLKGEEIPLEGRIVAVADVLDALLSDRPYRPAMSTEEAVGLIVEERGTHFDPAVVDALTENLAEALALRDGGAK